MNKLKHLLNNGENKHLYRFLLISGVVIAVVYIIGFSGVLDKSEYDVSENEEAEKAEMETSSPVEEEQFFTLGSSKDEVLAIQGKPTSIVKESWFYGGAKVDFQGDTVVSYNNRQRILRVKLQPKLPTDKQYFSVGLTKDEVVAVQGTPTNIVGTSWYYGASKVEFENGVVVAFSDRQRILNVRPTSEY